MKVHGGLEDRGPALEWISDNPAGGGPEAPSLGRCRRAPIGRVSPGHKERKVLGERVLGHQDEDRDSRQGGALPSFCSVLLFCLFLTFILGWVFTHSFPEACFWYTLDPNHCVNTHTHTTDTRVLFSFPNHVFFLFLPPITSEPPTPSLLSLPLPHLSDWISLCNPG